MKKKLHPPRRTHEMGFKINCILVLMYANEKCNNTKQQHYDFCRGGNAGGADMGVCLFFFPLVLSVLLCLDVGGRGVFKGGGTFFFFSVFAASISSAIVKELSHIKDAGRSSFKDFFPSSFSSSSSPFSSSTSSLFFARGGGCGALPSNVQAYVSDLQQICQK